MSAITLTPIISFNAYELFKIQDREKGFCCVAHAPSQGRRCHNPINKADRALAYHLLEILPSISRNEPELQRQLEVLAILSICKNSRIGHVAQKDNVVRQWKGIVQREVARQQQQVPSTIIVRTAPQPVRPEIRQLLAPVVRRVRSVGTASLATPSQTPQSPVRPFLGRRSLTTGERRPLLHSHHSIIPPTPPAPVQRPPAPVQQWSAPVPHQPTSVHQQRQQQPAAVQQQSASVQQQPTSTQHQPPVVQGQPVPMRQQTSPLRTEPPPVQDQSVPTAESIADERVCPVCLENEEDPVETPCGHRYCRSCITAWLDRHATCPMDRGHLRLGDLRPAPSSSSASEAAI